MVEVFLAPVNSGNHPYAEAAFLEQIGSVGLSVMDEDLRGGFSKGDGRAYDLFVNYTTPDFPVVINAAWLTGSRDEEISTFSLPTSQLNSDTDSYFLSLGKYLTKGMLTRIGYRYYEYKSMFTNFFPPMRLDMKLIDRQYLIDAKYVSETANDRAYAVQAFIVKDELSGSGVQTDSNLAGLAVDYYFTRRLRVGVGVLVNDSDNTFMEGKTYSANVRMFITPRISLLAGYDRVLNDNDSNFNYRDYSFTVAARF